MPWQMLRPALPAGLTKPSQARHDLVSWVFLRGL